MFLASTPENAVLSQTNSIQFKFCAEFPETNDGIAVLRGLVVGFARNSLKDLML